MSPRQLRPGSDEESGAGRAPLAASGPDIRAWAVFLVCCAIWGSTFLVISFGNDTLAPLWAAALRVFLAALLLGTWMLATGRAMPRGLALAAAVGYGVAQFGVNLPLLYWGEKTVPSGVSAVIYATIPLSSALMARMFRLEELTARKLFAALIALAGVGVLFSSEMKGLSGSPRMVAGFAAILVGATAASLGTVLLKRGPRQDPIAANAVGSAAGAVLAGLTSVAARESHAFPSSLRAAWPLVYLTVAGSLIAYVLMSWLVTRWSVTRTSYITVVVPVIALVLGALLRHEPVRSGGLAGSAMVLGALVIGMGSKTGPRRRSKAGATTGGMAGRDRDITG